MKYCVENQLELFQFHDSEFSFVSFDGKNLVVSVKYLNIQKNTEQNPSGVDMEIENALLTFRGVGFLTYETGRDWKTGENGESYPVEKRVVYSEGEAEAKALQAFKKGITVFDFDCKEDDTYFIDGFGIDPFFTVEFRFDSVCVEWDAYRKEAWYELYKCYQYEFSLRTPDGDEKAKVTVVDTYEDQKRAVRVGLNYGGKELWGCGSDYLWIDAFADLQKKLPEGVRLQCCLSCRHGNLCPVGTDHNELFCTKDVVITQKSDLYFYTEDYAQRDKRTRQYCHLCEDYQPQSSDYYTYNDYLYHLQKG